MLNGRSLALIFHPCRSDLSHVTRALPKPLSDDGDAYRMETEHLNGWETCVPGSDDAVRCWWWMPGLRREKGPWHRDRKAAACMAMCEKYRDHPEHGAIARHLLKRLEKR